MGDAPVFTVGWVFNLEVIPKHSHAQRDIALLCLLSSLTFVSICVRFATRWHKLKAFGIDDYFALFGGVSRDTHFSTLFIELIVADTGLLLCRHDDLS